MGTPCGNIQETGTTQTLDDVNVSVVTRKAPFETQRQFAGALSTVGGELQRLRIAIPVFHEREQEEGSGEETSDKMLRQSRWTLQQL